MMPSFARVSACYETLRALADEAAFVLRRHVFRASLWKNAAFAVILTITLTEALSVYARAELSKSVLFLNSYGPAFAPYNFLTEKLRHDLAVEYDGPIDYYDASLASARHDEVSSEIAFADYLRSLFRQHRLELIIAIGAPAARFVQAHRSSLFPQVPMLLTAVESRRLDPQFFSADDVVVAFNLDLPALISNILTVLPGTKRIEVVIGNSPNEQFWLSQLKKELAPFEERVGFNWLNALTFEEILKQLAATPPGTAILFGPFTVDGAGNVHQGDRSLAKLHDIANAPLFSYVDAYFGHGVVGGPQISLTAMSKTAAKAATSMLHGHRPDSSDIAVAEFGVPIYDWRELQKWNISEALLPSGSIIEFRSPGFWTRYRYYILLGILITALQSFLIIGLLANRRSLSREHAERLRAELEAQQLSGRLIHAHEDERAHLARELHDDITQRLALLSIDAGHIEKELSPGFRSTRFTSMRENLVRLSEDVHALSYRLHPSILEDLGLPEAIKSECHRFADFSDTEVACEIDDCPGRLPSEAALCLFRVAQESLRNIARHTEATEAYVSVSRARGGLELIVRDNGAGFDTKTVSVTSSLGQASMRQRTRHLGGTFTIESAPGKGTLVRAWIPVREDICDASESTTG